MNENDYMWLFLEDINHQDNENLGELITKTAAIGDKFIILPVLEEDALIFVRYKDHPPTQEEIQSEYQRFLLE